MAMSAACMVEDGGIKISRSELGRAESLLAMSTDWGIDERDILIALFRVEIGLRKV